MFDSSTGCVETDNELDNDVICDTESLLTSATSLATLTNDLDRGEVVLHHVVLGGVIVELVLLGVHGSCSLKAITMFFQFISLADLAVAVIVDHSEYC